MDPYEVINSPIVTEKSTELSEKENKYSFQVKSSANKVEIGKAIEEIYKVKVLKVNTMKVHGKKRRIRWREGKTPDWKKAIVTLREGDKIEVT